MKAVKKSKNAPKQVGGKKAGKKEKAPRKHYPTTAAHPEERGKAVLTTAETQALYAILGERIERARAKLGVTHDVIAERVGRARTSISNIANGTQLPPLFMVYHLGLALDKRPLDLLPTLDQIKARVAETVAQRKPEKKAKPSAAPPPPAKLTKAERKSGATVRLAAAGLAKPKKKKKTMKDKPLAAVFGDTAREKKDAALFPMATAAAKPISSGKLKKKEPTELQRIQKSAQERADGNGAIKQPIMIAELDPLPENASGEASRRAFDRVTRRAKRRERPTAKLAEAADGGEQFGE